MSYLFALDIEPRGIGRLRSAAGSPGQGFPAKAQAARSAARLSAIARNSRSEGRGSDYDPATINYAEGEKAKTRPVAREPGATAELRRTRTNSASTPQ
jgi:hypothetical protein